MNENLQTKPTIPAVQAAALFGITPNYVALLCRRGKVKASQVGRTWYVDEYELSQYLSQTKNKNESRHKALSQQLKYQYSKKVSEPTKTFTPSPFAAITAGLAIFVLAAGYAIMPTSHEPAAVSLITTGKVFHAPIAIYLPSAPNKPSVLKVPMHSTGVVLGEATGKVPASAPVGAYVSKDYVDQQINSLKSIVYAYESVPGSMPSTGGYTNSIALTQRIDRLDHVVITNATVNGVSDFSSLGGNFTDTNTIAFSFGSNFGQLAAATTSALWAQNGIFASSTSHFATADFANGFLSFASSTIGNGTQRGGLTVSGGATTTLNAYFASRVAIGTTSPTAKLDIFADSVQGLHIAEADQIPYALMINDLLYGSTDSTGVGFWQDTNGSAQIDVAGTTRLSVAANGDVGVGTGFTLPSALFHVQAKGSTDSTFFLIASSTTGLATSTYLTVNRSGFVGIGTSSPATLFSIAGTSGIFASTTGTSTFQGGGINLLTAAGNTGCYAVNGSCIQSATFSFPYTPTTNFGVAVNSTSTPVWFRQGLMSSSTSYIASTTFALNGNVGIGTTSPDDLLTIARDGDAYLKIQAITGTGQIAGIKLQRGGTGTTQNDYTIADVVGNLRIDSNDGNPFLGINTTPDATFSIKTSTNLPVLNLYGITGVTDPSQFNPGVIQVSDAGSLLNPNSRPLALQPNAGSVLIGTTTGYARLTVWATTTSQTSKVFELVNTSSTTLFSVSNTGLTSAQSLLVSASSTIGDGSQLGGLTVNGWATTTALRISSSTPSVEFFRGAGITSIRLADILGTLNLQSSTDNFATYTTPIAFGTGGNISVNANSSAISELSLTNYDNDTSYILSSWVDENQNTSFSATTRGNNTGLLDFYFNAENLGVGTTSPYTKLGVSLNVGDTNPFAFVIASTTGGTATSTLFVVGNNGYVGIGTSSPTAMLAINPDGATVPALMIGSSTATVFRVDVDGKVQVNQLGTLALVLGSTTGNARGTSALDIQTSRTALTQVASGAGAVAVGSGNTSSGSSAVSFGKDNANSGQNGVALGLGNTVGSTNDRNISIGYQNNANQSLSVALGISNVSYGGSSFAAGQSTIASGLNSYVFGLSAIGVGVSSYAVGQSAVVFGTRATALGFGNIGSASSSLTVGLSNIAGNAPATATNSGQTVTIAGGDFTSQFANGDLVTMRSTNIPATQSLTGTINSAVTFNSGPNTTTFTISGTIPGNGQISIASVTKGQNSQLVGSYNFTGTTGVANVLVGLLNNQTGGTIDPTTGAISGTPVAVTTVGKLATAVGIANTTSGDYSLAVGWQNTVSATGASAFGSFITNSTASSTQIGPSNVAKLTILGTSGSEGFVGIGTTSPFANLSIHANNGSTNTTLFAIGSSTATATTTLFSISNTGNVGIGTTTPSAGPSSLTVASSSDFISIMPGIGDSSGSARIVFGSVSSSTRWITDNNAGIYRLFTSNNNLGNNGTVRMAIDGGTGNVGIGTSSPWKTLSVSGTGITEGIIKTTTTGSVNAANLQLDRGDAANGFAGLVYGTAGIADWIVNVPAGTTDLRWFASSTGEVMRLTAGGRLAVGTTTVQGENTLTLGSTGASTGEGGQLALLPQGTFSKTWLLDNYFGDFRVLNGPGTGASSAEIIRIASTTGNIGIGTSTPTGRLGVTAANTGNGQSAQGAAIFAFADGNERPAITGFGNIDGTLANATAAAIVVRQTAGTGRSINAAGTINASGADYAEYFYQDAPGVLQKADLVCLNQSGKTTVCTAGEVPIGIVSTNAGFVGNDLFNPEHPDDTALVALAGQVPTKVNLDGGEIHVGDHLAPSTQPGFAMRATSTARTIGIALESFTATSSATSSIVVYVQPELTVIKSDQEALAGLATLTTTSTATSSNSFVENFFHNIFARITTWLADATNGIGEFFAGRVHTKEICIGESGNETCITKDKLDSLLAGAGASQGGGGSAPAPDQVSVSSSEPTIDVAPQPEAPAEVPEAQASEPAPEPPVDAPAPETPPPPLAEVPATE